MKITLTIVFTVLFWGIIFSQTNSQSTKGQFFAQLDKVKGGIKTDKILFHKNCSLDTLTSKIYLDSLTDFLIKNPSFIIEISLTKGYNLTYQYQSSKEAQMQAQSIANYLVLTRTISQERLVYHSSWCGSPHISDDELLEIQQKKSDKTIRTSIKVLNSDYRPK